MLGIYERRDAIIACAIFAMPPTLPATSSRQEAVQAALALSDDSLNGIIESLLHRSLIISCRCLHAIVCRLHCFVAA